jgi:hypothetical protein
MTGKIVLIFLLLLLCAVVFPGTTKPNSETALAAGSQEAPVSSTQAQSLKDDLAKMRSLEQQMEVNLSLVDTTQSPLKHQFQLEIDMWRLMIQRMEERLQGTK